jgi:trans-2,3-dihydro-3-hydroxyanthranilate isomerase
MRTYRYLHLDVFTSTPFEGNQLAVFSEPGGLTTADMLTITREMNFSECTFIFPAERPDTDCRMRIFTPGEEMPMAGHPTIGSTFALAHEGVIRAGSEQFVFGLGVGPTPVSLAWKDGHLDFAWMTQPLPTFGDEVPDRQGIASALGVEGSDVDTAGPIQVVSCGVPFLYVPLLSRSAVDRVAINIPTFRAWCRAAGIEELPVFVFTRDRAGSTTNESVYARMLAPGLGIAEDPATGAASGPLGCYLAAHALLPDVALDEFVSLQGAAMKRPSQIHISIQRASNRITRVRVGGRSVLVGHGVLRL